MTFTTQYDGNRPFHGLDHCNKTTSMTNLNGCSVLRSYCIATLSTVR